MRYSLPFGDIAIGAIIALMVAAAADASDLAVHGGAASAGDSGLEVTVGTGCTEADRVIEPPTHTEISGSFAACNSISANTVQVIDPGAEFIAGSSIELGDDFAVPAGVPFTAGISAFIASPFAWVEDSSPPMVRAYKATFDIDPNDLAVSGGDELQLLVGRAAGGDEWFRVIIDSSGLTLEAREDDGTPATAPLPGLPAGFSTVEIFWLASSGPGNSDGHLLLSVNGGDFDGPTNLDNDLGVVDLVRWGAVGGTPTTNGSFYLDEFLSFR